MYHQNDISKKSVNSNFKSTNYSYDVVGSQPSNITRFFNSLLDWSTTALPEIADIDIYNSPRRYNPCNIPQAFSRLSMNSGIWGFNSNTRITKNPDWKISIRKDFPLA